MARIKIATRKIDKKEYQFYLDTVNSWVDGEETPYIIIETPPNGLGYEDYILMSAQGHLYTTNRYLQPWILKQLEGTYRRLAKKNNVWVTPFLGETQ